jgi:hypothetical protein
MRYISLRSEGSDHNYQGWTIGVGLLKKVGLLTPQKCVASYGLLTPQKCVASYGLLTPQKCVASYGLLTPQKCVASYGLLVGELDG